eukprot:CAMPEP_0183309380 /NCGR_PEP_ID=MMETSP0160_2-20130417/25219_1 /TAXON_ID=2839 ORGANISM="Odontella Sinensis, Strain Grunow 1884" /NCGR_SAMPLE_ID=MMETSP0160_2 /ASSEMBLY_ACC=CAM_ASM_000250 /LENGTH=313 /DNA_ID=CAMNT_0025473403 /DNA_START=56 /DNA_END=997 /DNA_ORIENTATION=+
MDLSSDFQTRAAAAASRILSTESNGRRSEKKNPAELLAESLTRDVPTIDSAVKSYISLVVARSMTLSQTDQSTAAAHPASVVPATEGGEGAVGAAKNENIPSSAPKCVLSNLDALRCARALIRAVNSLVIPDDKGERRIPTTVDGKKDEPELIEGQVVRIVWNGIVAKGHKPTKLLGRRALRYAYPHIIRVNEEVSGKTGVAFCGVLPRDVDLGVSLSFFEEFGALLMAPRPQRGEEDKDNDSALLWEADRGAAELRRRRGRRAMRGEDAVKSSKDGAKQLSALVAGHCAEPSLSGASSVVIEEIHEADEHSK